MSCLILLKSGFLKTTFFKRAYSSNYYLISALVFNIRKEKDMNAIHKDLAYSVMEELCYSKDNIDDFFILMNNHINGDNNADKMIASIKEAEKKLQSAMGKLQSVI